ncbi:MAG: protein kinase, partial [Sandaracinaceae bacterium]|nr:protein kinase [Sandaracinaceae bacterium]
MIGSSAIPTSLGRYRILQRLGSGGMAEVFLAKYTGAQSIEKLVVIKRILPSFARNPRFVSMFVDEAKLATRLNHPNIVQVYAFEQVQDEFLLAMEYVDGLDLGQLVQLARREGRRIPYEVASLIVFEVCKGLEYAHNRKDESGVPMEIVHRDVSPQNILISYDGNVKIADFGIARAKMISEETGVIKGKFGYMSPEQAKGQRVDRRSDIYSLGVVFAELLMNRPMYPGMQGIAILDEVREGRITLPRTVDPEIPEALEAVVVKATRLHPEDRFESCRAFGAAISSWIHDQRVDPSALEAFIATLRPRDALMQNEATRGSPLEISKQPTVFSLNPGLAPPLKERRNLIVLSGYVGDHTGRGLDAPLVEQVRKVIENIAWKYETHFEWNQSDGEAEFRLIIGLRNASIDDPLHAACLALDVLEAIEGMRADGMLPIAVRIGIARGLVGTMWMPASPPRFEPNNQVFELARCVARGANWGEVLTTGELYRLVRRSFAFDERGERFIEAEGIGPLRAYQLKRARTREERDREAASLASQFGLVGRLDEIQALVECYEGVVTQGVSAYVVIVGDIGIGKSALVSAAIGRFRPDPTLIRVDCPFGTEDIPYAALIELLRNAWKIEEQADVDTIRSRIRQKVGRIIRAAERREAAIEAFETLVVPNKKEEGIRDQSQRLFHAVRDFLKGLAEQRPTVVWVDSAQFADAPTLDLLSRLFANPIDAPLLIMVCTRPGPRLEALLNRALRIELKELSEKEREALVEAHLG